MAENREIVGGFFGSIGSAFKKIAKSPLLKIVATGAAFVVPAVGVPLLAASAAANGLIAATGDAKKAATALAVIGRTRALAKTGDANAKRAVALLATAAKSHVAARKPISRAVAKANPKAKVSKLTKPKMKPLLTTPAQAKVIAAKRGLVPLAAKLPTPAPATPRAPSSSGPVEQGWLIYTTGPKRGQVDFTHGRWNRA